MRPEFWVMVHSCVFFRLSLFSAGKSSWFCFSLSGVPCGINNLPPLLCLAFHELLLHPSLGYQENWALSQDEYNGARGLHQRIYPSQQYFPLPAGVRPPPKEAGPSECLRRWRRPQNADLRGAVSFPSHVAGFLTYSVNVAGSGETLVKKKPRRTWKLVLFFYGADCTILLTFWKAMLVKRSWV